jgi:hypothetical protein
MATKSQSPSSQKPTTFPYTKPDPRHSLPTDFLKLHYNTILPSTTRFSKWSPSLSLPEHNILCSYSLPHTCHMPCPSNYSWFNHPDNAWLEVRITLLPTLLSISHPVINKLYSLKCGCDSLMYKKYCS